MKCNEVINIHINYKLCKDGLVLGGITLSSRKKMVHVHDLRLTASNKLVQVPDLDDFGLTTGKIISTGTRCR